MYKKDEYISLFLIYIFFFFLGHNPHACFLLWSSAPRSLALSLSLCPFPGVSGVCKRVSVWLIGD